MSDDSQFRPAFSVISTGTPTLEEGDRRAANLHVVEPLAAEAEDTEHSVRELPISAETVALRTQLNHLRQEHKDLDDSIQALETMPVPDQILILRLKRKKLALRDQIAKIEDKIRPDIIA